ncbi:alpha-actinin sarcomeric-like protein [Anaeramoeba ignava]|uniref:Alpha-actinin sarcomeric-like protein n=1 Tax=Anaeramoeba ignava TaxID=1746090 RepID=A0A9Q0RH84_ANAIG|nr:alpha-actinin sarcomeric-like protein [Anaeramoeba ignava]
MSKGGKEELPDWVKMQQKTFTRWFNKHLKRVKESITDLQEGLEDGLKFIKFVELVTEKKINRYNKRPKLRIQKIENIKIAMEQIQNEKKFQFASIGPEDIVDKNLKLILGFVWTIIMKCSIEDISVEELTAKEALLLWCKKQTAGYQNVNVRNFTSSWKDGLAFAAIIHHNKPSMLDFYSLDQKKPAENLETAFEAANQLGIDRFLDVEDMLIDIPDEKAVMAYLAEYFQYFSSGAKQQNAARRIGKLMDFTQANDELKQEYNRLGEELLKWIEKKTDELNQREFPNTKEEMEKLISEFAEYKNHEKPPKATEKINLEALYNTIARKLEAHQRPKFIPTGPSVEKIQEKWDELEEAEKLRGKILNEELGRQERIEGLLSNFNNKVKKLEQFHKDKKNYLTSPHEVSTLMAANQELKRLDASDDEYERSKKRLEEVKEIGKKIVEENYKDKDEVIEKMKELDDKWDELKSLSEKLREKLENDKKREERKEYLRKKWGQLAKDYTRWIKDESDSIRVYEFGYTLEAVEKYKSPMEENEKNYRNQSDGKYQKLEKLWKKMQDIGIEDNRYTALTLDDVKDVHKQLEDELEKRNQAYKKELERQIAMDEKRKEFAKAADDFLEYLKEHLEEINKPTGEPQPLIEAIKGIHQDGAPSKEELEKVIKIDQEMREMGIPDNKYTEHTVASLGSKRTQDIDLYVDNYIAALNEEHKQKELYKLRATKWIEEVNAIIEKLQALSFDNTLEDARAKTADFAEYMSTQHSEKSAQKTLIENLADDISKYLKAQPYNRPEFVYEDGLSLEDIEAKWKELEKEEADHKKKIDDEVKRQELCDELQKRFHDRAANLQRYIDASSHYLKANEEIKTINLAQTQINRLENFKKDLEESKELVSDLKELKNQLEENKYHKISEIAEKLEKLEEEWKALSGLQDEKKKRLDDIYEKMDEKRKEFAKAADDFLEYLKKHLEEINTPTGEPQPLIEAIKGIHQDGAPSKEELEKVIKIDQEMREMEITDNKYTDHTVASLSSKRARDIDGYVHNYISALNEEQQQKDFYKQRATKWMEDVNGMIQKLQALSFDNTLEDARAKTADFAEYINTQHSEKSAQKTTIANLSDNINSYLKHQPYNRPEFAHPEGLSPDDLETKWKELHQEESEHRKKIDKELKRQEKCDELQKQFHNRAANLQRYIDASSHYFNAEEEIQTLQTAQIQLRKLDNSKTALENSKSNVDKLKKIENDLKEHNYHKIDDISDEMNKLESAWNSLFELHDAKKKRLDDALEREQHKDSLRREFAEKAGSYRVWFRKAGAQCRDFSFGRSLEEVKAFKEKLDQANQEMTEKSQEFKSELSDLDQKMKELNVTENRFTRITLDDVNNFNDELLGLIKKKNDAYDTELARQEAMEEKRIEFAKEADNFVKLLNEKKEQFDQITGEPEEKTEQVNKIYEEGKPTDEQFTKLQQLDAESKAMKIVQNKHTELDMQILKTKKKWYDNFVANLLASIEEEKKMKERAAQLQKEWESKRKNEEMIQEYAAKSQELNSWIEIATEKMTEPITSTTPQENETLKNEYDQFLPQKEPRENEYKELQDLANKMNEAEITNFSGLPIETVAGKWNEISTLIEQRKDDLEKDAQKQEAHEKLRIQFADMANDLHEYMTKTKKDVSELSGNLDDQLEVVKKIISELISKKSVIDSLTDLESEMEAQHIKQNPHTAHTVPETKQTYSQLMDFANKQQDEITNQNLESQGKKVTEQQMKEFREVFDHFDKNKSGSLDKLEFSGCLKSLGEDMSDEELDKVFQQIDTDKSGKIEFDEFVTFMASRTVDMDTKDQILESFRDLSKTPGIITEQEFQDYFSKEQIEYFKQHMPQEGDGYNYEKWTQDVFDR